MDDTIIPYLAGLFDGEGCIRTQSSKTGAPTLVINMSNTNLPILKLFEQRYGGRVRGNRKKFSHYLAMHKWDMAGQPAKRMLLELLPWLIIKKSQAELGLQLFELQGKRDENNHKQRRILAQRIKDEKRVEYIV